MSKVCQVVNQVTNQCDLWLEQSNFLVELSMLSYSDINQLLALTAANFALAWVFKKLSLFTSQP